MTSAGSAMMVESHRREYMIHHIFCWVVLCILLLRASAVAEGIRCWVRCGHPPVITTVSGIAPELRFQPNPQLRFLDRSIGLLTTYAGKMLGIQGWRAYGIQVQIDGTVLHAVGSSDGFYTIDLAIAGLTANGIKLVLPQQSYIRAEIVPWVRCGAALPVRPNQNVCVSGTLEWDGDGFLEIHPKRADDILPTACPHSVP